MVSNVFVVNSVSADSISVLGVYATEKAAKDAMKAYAAENGFRKKIPNKEDSSKLMYASDSHKIYLSARELEGVKQPAVKAAKDPNAPKKAVSAYMLFAADNRQKIKEANPQATFGELGKLIGDAWKALSDDAKAVYKQKEADDKVRYEKESTAYEGTQA